MTYAFTHAECCDDCIALQRSKEAARAFNEGGMVLPSASGSAYDDFDAQEQHAAKQALAAPARYYGGIGTIHDSTELDVETDIVGRVVAVWFRCQQLPFHQVRVDADRVREMRATQDGLPKLTGVEVLDQ